MTQTEPNPTDPCPEDPEDALLEGDRTFTPGTAASALRHRTFRTVYFGAFASNIGTWMQNVVLGALAYELSGGSPLFVGLIMFAQLGPLLVLSMVGGMLADAVDRKKLLIALTVEQALFSGLLALVALGGDDASKWALFAVTLAIGIGNALYAPTFSAILPILVPREDMAGAISLNSAQMNGSRVVGPAIGAFLYAQYGASWVFLLNALSYVAIIVVLARVPLPKPVPSRHPGPPPPARRGALRPTGQGGRPLPGHHLHLLAAEPAVHHAAAHGGRREPRHRAEERRLRPALRRLRLGRGRRRAVDRHRVRRRRRRPSSPATACSRSPAFLTLFALLRASAPAYPVIFGLGAVYFAVITSLSTVLQQDLDDSVRGKVMALWIMGFGGTVPIGGLLGGLISEQVDITWVMLGGAAVAVGLAAYAQLEREPAVGTRFATAD